jgi:hypothetical protein
MQTPMILSVLILSLSFSARAESQTTVTKNAKSSLSTIASMMKNKVERIKPHCFQNAPSDETGVVYLSGEVNGLIMGAIAILSSEAAKDSQTYDVLLSQVSPKLQSIHVSQRTLVEKCGAQPDFTLNNRETGYKSLEDDLAKMKLEVQEFEKTVQRFATP